MVIHGLESAEALPGVNVFHSGTAKRGSDIVTAGGRVLTVVASGEDYRSAIDRAYEAVGHISFDRMHYRKDIGAKALSMTHMPSLQVLILIGSPNDAPVMQGAVDVLKELGISVEMTVASPHIDRPTA